MSKKAARGFLDLGNDSKGHIRLDVEHVPGETPYDGEYIIRGTKLMKIGYEHAYGGGCPGGHRVFRGTKSGKPFITPSTELNSIALRESDHVVDIGAYVGTYALRCARFPVKRVRAYEPTPITFDLLSKSPMPNLEIFNAAIVGDDTKTVSLFIADGIGVTNSILKSRKKIGSIAVEALNYAKVVKGATIVKIDVEGAEYSYPILQPGVRAYLIDFHKTRPDWIERAEEIIQTLLDDGFETVIKPNWGSGWSLGGSWLKPTPESEESGYEPMLSGKECCGCAAPISTKGKGLCVTCAAIWSGKSKKGYEINAEG